MKKSQDMPMADRSKISSTHPTMADKKGEPSGSSPARGIGPMGVDMCSGEAPSMAGYSHTPDGAGPCRNHYGIGEGDGGPTIDKIDSSNPGDAL